jgi:hypothetical protein
MLWRQRAVTKSAANHDGLPSPASGLDTSNNFNVMTMWPPVARHSAKSALRRLPEKCPVPG